MFSAVTGGHLAQSDWYSVLMCMGSNKRKSLQTRRKDERRANKYISSCSSLGYEDGLDGHENHEGNHDHSDLMACTRTYVIEDSSDYHINIIDDILIQNM